MTAFLASEAAAIWVASLIGVSWAMILLLIPTSGVLFIVFRQRGRRDFSRAALMLALCAAGLLIGILAVARMDLLANGSIAVLTGEPAEVYGQVSWAYESSFGMQYTIGKLEGPDGKRFKGLLLIDGKDMEGAFPEGLLPGDRIEVRGRVRLIDGRMNPGAFDARAYWFSKGVHASLEGAALIDAERGWAGLIKEAAWAFSRSFKAFTDKAMGECVANPLMDAIALSDKSDLDPAVSEAFRKGGLAHVMSASGLHVSIVMAFMSFIIGKAGATAWLSLLMAGSILPVYAVAAGLRPSIIRACMTGMAASAARAFRLKGPDQAGILLAAASIQMAVSPMSLFDPGFQMSYMAVIGIMAASALFRDGKGKTGAGRAFIRHISFALTGSLIISAALLPVMSTFYGYASILSPVANLVAIPAASAALTIGLAGYLAHWVSPGLGSLIALPAKYILIMLDALAGRISRIEALLIPTGHESGIFAALYLAVIATAWLCLTGRLSARRMAKSAFTRLGPAIPAALAAVLVASLMAPQEVAIRIFSVGQGDSILISKGRSFHMLVDTGPGFPGGTAVEERILPALRSIGVDRVDVLSLTHSHSDHTSGLNELAEGISIGLTLVADGDFETAGKVRQAGLEPTFISRGGSISSGGLRIESVNGVSFDSSADDANEPSMVLMVGFSGQSAILCADAGGRFEAAYNRGPAAFLKVGHHGSKTSSSDDFLRQLGSADAAISVGANFYGHPSPEAIGRLVASGMSVWRTDFEGMITVMMESEGISVLRESDSWDRMPFFRALKETGGIGINPSLNVK